MRLITKHNNLQESYHKLQIDFSKSDIENAELRRLNKELSNICANEKSNYQYLRNKIIENPESILHHIKLSKIENYVRKSKLKRIESK